MNDSESTCVTLKTRFLSASLGSIIKVTHIDVSMPVVYLMLCKSGAKWYEERYPYHAVNLSNGYLWGLGDTTLNDTLDNWFTREDELVIADLEIIPRNDVINILCKEG